MTARARTMRPAVARVRLAFAKRDGLRFIGHLDLVRAWERALRRAGLPVAWTQGFTPRPRLSFAAPLPLGAEAERELADLFLTEQLEVDEVLGRLGAQLPTGCDLTGADAVPLDGPSLPSLVRWARYEFAVGTARPVAPSVVQGGSRWSRRVPDDATINDPGDGPASPIQETSRPKRGASRTTPEIDEGPTRAAPGPVALVPDPFRRHDPGVESPLRPVDEWLPPESPDEAPVSREEVARGLAWFLSQASVTVPRMRDGKATTVDAREAVLAATLVERPSPGGMPVVAMVVRHDATVAGRPDDVAAALGYRAATVNRRAVGIEGEAPPGI